MTTSAPIHRYAERDDYGRSCLVLEQSSHLLATRIAIPRRTAPLADGTTYLVRDHQMAVTYRFPSRKQANVMVEAIAARHI